MKGKKIIALFLSAMLCIGSVSTAFAYDTLGVTVKGTYVGQSADCGADVQNPYGPLNLSVNSIATLYGVPQALITAECFVTNTVTGERGMMNITKTFDIINTGHGCQIEITDFNTGNYVVSLVFSYDIIFKIPFHLNTATSNHCYLSAR